MAAMDAIKSLTTDVSCPICQGYFEDPVITQCGHNFCRSCITQRWKELNADFPCPQCKSVTAQPLLLPNGLLNKFVEVARLINIKVEDEENPKALCEKHQEALKLFCKEHQKPICVVCDRSRDHRSHTVYPIEEAAQEYKIKLQDWLVPLKDKVQRILKSKCEEELDYKSTMGELRSQREKILCVFEELEQFLEQEKQRVLEKLEKKKKTNLQLIRKRMTGMLMEKSTLQKLIIEIEGKCRQLDLELLKDVKSLVDRCDDVFNKKSKADYSEREKTSECFKAQCDFLHEHLKVLKGNFPKELDASAFKGFKVDFTLDPKSLHPQLILSKDFKNVVWSKKRMKLPAKSNRMESDYSVLGSKGFSAGHHYWEVELVREGQLWSVGVIDETWNRRGDNEWSPRRGIWTIEKEKGLYLGNTRQPSPFFPRDDPRKLGVYLDYELGCLFIYNAETMENIFMFSKCTFTGVVFPFFYLFKGGEMFLR